MKSVKLEQYEEITIVEMRKYHLNAKVRERAHAVELSNMGKCIKIVAEILHRTKKTIAEWIKKYENFGIAGFFDKERSGRPKEVTEEIENRIREIAESNETCTKYSITENIENEFGVRFHPNTIKYHLKKR